MHLTLFTNMPSHYQIALAQVFAERLGADFALVCWGPGTPERRDLGWSDAYQEPWLIRAWESGSSLARAHDLLLSTHVAIWGYAPEELIRKRIVQNKLTFCYRERIFKQRWRRLDPRVRLGINKAFRSIDVKCHHLLAAGSYCAEDFHSLGLFRNRMWCWGYFPEIPRHEVIPKSNHETIVLWAGRMLQWKRVDLLLQAAAWAVADGGPQFRLKLIGMGPEEERLRSLAIRFGLDKMCEFQGPQAPALIGAAMEEAAIYVFPSNRNEGWGVVVNEAMSRQCCVIGSKWAGSVPWLIRDGVNGYVFDSDDPKALGRILRRCIDNMQETTALGVAARQTIVRSWSPSVAADRFLVLSDALERGNASPFSDGVCAPAI